MSIFKADAHFALRQSITYKCCPFQAKDYRNLWEKKKNSGDLVFLHSEEGQEPQVNVLCKITTWTVIHQ